MVHGINGKREGLKCVRKYQEQQQALQTLQKHGKKLSTDIHFCTQNGLYRKSFAHTI